MVKQIELIKRKPGTTPEEFRRHYEEVFAPFFVKSSPYVKRYARNYFVRSIAGEPPFDCITELWFDNMEALEANLTLLRSEKGKPIRDGVRRFIDFGGTIAIVADEQFSSLP